MNPTTLLSGLGAAITADPSLGGASTTGRQSNPGGGDLFLALVNGLLQGSSQEDLGSVPGLTAETASPPAITNGVGPVAGSTDDAPADTEADAAVTELPTDPAMVPIALAMTPLAAQPPVLAAAGGSADKSVPAAVVSSTEAATVAPGSPSSTGGSAQAGAGAGAGADQQDNSAATSPDGPVPTAEAPDQAVAAAPAGPRAEVRTDAVPTQPAGVSAAVAVAPTAASVPVTTSTTSADLPRVTDQVFPEVLRATSNAENGTSRVTVKLNPESLGEVRVVLTQRGGELEVTLAGGTDARRALTEGAPELRRLLESVGRADSRIFIRDLPTAPTLPTATAIVASGPATRTDVSTDLAGGAWSGAGSPGGEPAPDRDGSRHHPGSSTATDGIPSVTPGSRPIQTAGRSHAGLDLSM